MSNNRAGPDGICLSCLGEGCKKCNQTGMHGHVPCPDKGCAAGSESMIQTSTCPTCDDVGSIPNPKKSNWG